MRTLSVALIVGNEKEFIKECLLSVKDFADEIVIILDDKSNDGTEEIIKSMNLKNLKLIKRKWEMAKTKQYAYEQCTKDWVLCLDGDEVLSDNGHILKDFIELSEKNNVNSVDIRSHHLMYNFGWEDCLKDKHFHSRRFFKNDKNIFKIVGKNHAMLVGGSEEQHRFIDIVHIFHFGYIKHMNKILEKYNMDMEIQQVHTPKFLNDWFCAHIFGNYPIKTFNPIDFPPLLKKKFCIEKNGND